MNRHDSFIDDMLSGRPYVKSGNGFVFHYLNGMRHRENGPAAEHKDGHKYWWLNGKRHRIDGPAVEIITGEKKWFLFGKEYTEEEHLKCCRKL